VRPQPRRIVVGAIERHPDHWLWAFGTPRPDQCGLAVTDSGIENGYSRSAIAVEHPEQAPAAQRPRVDPGQHQLWLDYKQALNSSFRRL
jgi:hypothetical protein